jgi:hypothetical protein
MSGTVRTVRLWPYRPAPTLEDHTLPDLRLLIRHIPCYLLYLKAVSFILATSMCSLVDEWPREPPVTQLPPTCRQVFPKPGTCGWTFGLHKTENLIQMNSYKMWIRNELNRFSVSYMLAVEILTFLRPFRRSQVEIQDRRPVSRNFYVVFFIRSRESPG